MARMMKNRRNIIDTPAPNVESMVSHYRKEAMKMAACPKGKQPKRKIKRSKRR